MALVIDLLLIALGVFAFLYGKHRGFISMVWGAAAWLITVLITAALIAPVTVAVSHTQPVLEFKENIAGHIKKNIYDHSGGVMDAADFLSDRDALSESTGIPAILIPEMDLSSSIESTVSAAADNIVESASNSVIRAVVGVMLFIGIRVIMGAVYRILRAVSRLPVIKGVNRLIGGLLGLINYMFVVYAVLAVISLIVVKDGAGQSIIEQTYLAKYFYNNNILLNLINF